MRADILNFNFLALIKLHSDSIGKSFETRTMHFQTVLRLYPKKMEILY